MLTTVKLPWAGCGNHSVAAPCHSSPSYNYQRQPGNKCVTRFTKTLDNIRSQQEVVPHLGVSAVRELHVGAAPLQAGGVRHELGGAQSLHLLKELHRAARHVAALLQTLPKTQ